MAKILVTGGAGFIGSHLTEALVKENHQVTVIDNLSSGKLKNFSNLKEKIKFIEKDIRSDLNEIFQKGNFDAVFHVAAIPEVQFSIENPSETHEVNVNGTLNVLLNCKNHKVKRLIFSSSSAIYGNQEKIPISEEAAPNPMSPYALHKLIGEKYCKLFNFLYNIETISLRYFNAYGPKQNPSGSYAGLIPKFISLISKQTAPRINGDGTQTRDFLHVSDIVEANLAAFQTNNHACFGKAFNIGGGKSISVNEIAKTIINELKSDIVPTHGPAITEPKHSLADISKSSKELNWRPKVSLEEGLRETILSFVKT